MTASLMTTGNVMRRREADHDAVPLRTDMSVAAGTLADERATNPGAKTLHTLHTNVCFTEGVAMMGSSTVDDTLDNQMRTASAGLVASDAVIALGRALRGSDLLPRETAVLSGLAKGFGQEADLLTGARPRPRIADGGYMRSAHALAGATILDGPRLRSLEDIKDVDQKAQVTEIFRSLSQILEKVAAGNRSDAERILWARDILRDLSDSMNARLTSSGESAEFFA
ncbi:hypothetical protein [Mycobacteroides abscessus]